MTREKESMTSPTETTARPETTIHEERLLIGGVLTRAAGDATFDVYNPATGKVAGVVADANSDDMDAAIAAARSA
ncbi:MAG: hypothetical protein ACRYF3_14070, partial [Janthinobacterium lividum]